MFSRFFIDRPIFATVLSVVITLSGGIAVFTLPVTQYPEIAPPTVEVSTMYPGANARVVADTVAAPIEQLVNGVEDMLYMASQSTNDGSYTLTVTFKSGTDLNMAQVRVQNRVNLAFSQLPEVVRATGITTRKRSPELLMTVGITSPPEKGFADGRYTQLYLSNYATINLVNELARVPGVGNVTVLGVGKYSMRIWMDPDKLYSYGLGPSDIIQVIKSQNQSVTAGQIGMPPADKGQNFQYTLDIEGLLLNPEQFGEIVVKASNADGGRILRMKDVARIEMGAQTYTQDSRLDGKPAGSIAIYQLPEANALSVATLRARAAELSRPKCIACRREKIRQPCGSSYLRINESIRPKRKPSSSAITAAQTKIAVE